MARPRAEGPQRTHLLVAPPRQIRKRLNPPRAYLGEGNPRSFNEARPHQALAQQQPIPRPAEPGAASRESPFSGGSITTIAEPREARGPHGPHCPTRG